ncbi:MAG: LPS export ABC transporter periplasmic protein LptC [Candidatus Accumulibacter sp.]|uniref:LPS export ABC transporter periplasmic protein LptC n=1 Tax=Accumulibacter sp. TaxID=2053492 RepID=UPI0019FC10AC|nr:LPS export ABC transporter periplasmic protein LptC [Accumulibacter sp.]MBE2257721.1 LPS export ABC transporter periplasmic protein LptC [Paracoccaceae bacterium]MCB1941278.1 LPS export ABC transporter periplasmic protein LptC [Accumulibacter sp.]MCP5249340.1 LPS export ABC transporter periplasmic protein LptC [Accumulibacter sp.]
MKQWSSALLPITILTILSALTFWLRYATELDETRGDGKHRHDPDYIVNDATVRKVGEQGQLEYTLQAAEIRHYPDDDSVELDQPKLVYLQPKKAPLTISAARGRLSAKWERVDLDEQVELRREAIGKQPPLVVETSQLTVLPDEEKAFTKSPVAITEGKSWLKGVGLQVDHKLQTYLLESRVTGEIESHLAKKKPKT